ncbi:MAG TPA: cobalamin-binding protein [Firmicutes bacterium]|nr:cobalamin-binding protein [Candidatus Fermentithermobacillaceae bacterium]
MRFGKKRIDFRVLLLAIFLVSVVLTGCKPQVKIFTDGAGRQLTLKGIPERIVSLAPAHTETVFALGLGDKLVGVTSFCNRPPEAQKKEVVGDAFNLNKEKLVALKPDIVLCAGTPDSQYVKEVESLGIPVYVSSPATVKEVFDDIQRIASVLGAEKAGKKLTADLQRQLDELKQRVEKSTAPKPRVFVVIDKDLWTVGPGSFMHDVLSLAGGENVIKDVPGQYLQVSMEELLAKDPDVILVTIPKEEYGLLESRPGWTSLRAVKEGRVFFVDADLVSRPGPSVVKGIEEVASHLYPQ